MKRRLLLVPLLALLLVVFITSSRDAPTAPATATRPLASPQDGTSDSGSSLPPAVHDSPREGGTTLVVLRVEPAGVELVAAIDKPTLPYHASGGHDARFLLEDAESGALVAEGDCAWPRLCYCELGRDHTLGCVRVPHSAVVRLKLPRQSRATRVRLTDSKGRTELGSFLLEEDS